VLDIFFVVTLFERKMEESDACRSLCTVRVPVEMRLSGLIFDNTSGKIAETRAVSTNILYQSSGINLGLPEAYNAAIQRGLSRGAKYLLLLDQDSVVSDDFLSGVVRALGQRGPEEVVWVPIVLSNDRLISPYRLSPIGLPQFGLDPRRRAATYFAINSFSLISLDYLQQLGGFERYYWLDALDSWFYSCVAETNGKVGIIDVEVSHNLSLLEGNVPVWRLLNIARYETCCKWERLTVLQAITGTGRILARGLLALRSLFAAGKCLAYVGAVHEGFRSGLARR